MSKQINTEMVTANQTNYWDKNQIWRRMDNQLGLQVPWTNRCGRRSMTTGGRDARSSRNDVTHQMSATSDRSKLSSQLPIDSFGIDLV